MPANSLPAIEAEEMSAADAIKAAAPFKDLPQPVVASLVEASNIRRYLAGETVYSMGQFDGSEFLIVLSGGLKVANADAKTGSMLFEHVPAGEIFGLALAVLGESQKTPTGVSLTAERDCVIVAVDSEALRQVATQRPSLTRTLMLYFARKLLGDQRSLDEGSPERRVYSVLTTLIERDAITAEWKIGRMPKHRELADRAGVEETDAANAVAKLIQSGVARRNYPGLVIADMTQLNRLSK